VPDIYTAFGLTALVLVIAALAAGLVVRGPISFPIIFLGCGFLLGDAGLGILDIDIHDQSLEVVAILSLALVLFLDAINLKVDDVRSDWLTPALALGPGTFLTIGIASSAAVFLLDASWTEGLLLGAILASTDPVVLRDVVRDRRVPVSVRRALSVEAGTNDLVVLPAVLILIAVAQGEASSLVDWLSFLGRLLILSPAIGLVVGAAGAWAMAKADLRFGISREYQALYGIGLVLAAFVAAQVARGDGFLAAFAAGFAVTFFNFELCDCFLEYGETTAEMAMLFAFVLFGAALSTTMGLVPFGLTLLFAAVVIGVARPLSFSLVLRRATASRTARFFISWFGPRGLNSLLLALLVIHSGLAEGEWLMGVVGVVVVVSVVVHGASATPLVNWYAGRVAKETLAEERETSAAGLFGHEPGVIPKLRVGELVERLASENPPLILDVRTRSQYERDTAEIPGSLRVPTDELTEWAREQDRKRQVIAYCT
jgi:NhaP-type Na+/H+ or K+/H+ antiporter